MRLEELAPPEGARHHLKRVGRGIGSGHGKTAGRGHKGQKARSGGAKGAMFEGGQMPLVRRVPKRGFTSRFREDFTEVKLSSLSAFEEGSQVSPDDLRKSGIIKRAGARVKILGDGEITRPLVVKAHAFTRSAREKIEQAGGKAEVI
ncbi:MAG: 50S ribosomal protein L15 [Firmicutes bacterium]|nr:50S ribosomal protein L15 [Bacillota bacterium]MDH7496593.1 50S ribosomal protein L15 [Bacillota bacterium]